MAKPRVHELAKELDPSGKKITSKMILAWLKDQGEFVKAASSAVEPPVARRVREHFASHGASARGGSPKPVPTAPKHRPGRPQAPKPGGARPAAPRRGASGGAVPTPPKPEGRTPRPAAPTPKPPKPAPRPGAGGAPTPKPPRPKPK